MPSVFFNETMLREDTMCEADRLNWQKNCSFPLCNSFNDAMPRSVNEPYLHFKLASQILKLHYLSYTS